MDVYFNEKKLPRARNEYVAFVDIMGTRTHMKKSVRETANFIFKFHSAVISAYREKAYKNVFVYPVMDGVYITAGSKEDITNILVRVYRNLSQLFLKENDFSYLYLIRGSVAYGEIIHGHNVPYEASKAFESNIGYKDQILLGSAMILAYDGEGKAAPFGVYVDDSAIKHEIGKYGAFSEKWKWFTDVSLKIEENLPALMSDKIQMYLESMKNPDHPLHYPNERIENHKQLAKEYFRYE